MSVFAFVVLRLREIANELRFTRGRGLRRAALLAVLALSWIWIVAATLGTLLGRTFAGLEQGRKLAGR